MSVDDHNRPRKKKIQKYYNSKSGILTASKDHYPDTIVRTCETGVSVSSSVIKALTSAEFETLICQKKVIDIETINFGQRNI